MSVLTQPAKTQELRESSLDVVCSQSDTVKLLTQGLSQLFGLADVNFHHAKDSAVLNDCILCTLDTCFEKGQ